MKDLSIYSYCWALLFLLCTLSLNGQTSEPDTVKNTQKLGPYILSQWAGGSFGDKEFELKYQGTYFYFNKFNLNIKDRFEMGFNFRLFGEYSSATFFKYHFHLNEFISIAPILYLADSFTNYFTPPDVYDFNLGLGLAPGLNLHLRSRDKTTGLILNYLYIPKRGTNHELSFLYGTESKEYVYGLNFYHFSKNLLFNLEWLGFKNDSMDRSTEDANENMVLLTFSYSKNKIVSYDFGFWTRISNLEKDCEYICINFFPTIGISLDLVDGFRRKKPKLLNN